MIIREAKKSDVLKIADLEADIFSDPWSERSVGDTLHSENAKILVAEESTLMGYVIFYYSLDCGDIARVAVRREFRREKIADRLLEHLWEYANQEKIPRILLEVREKNTPAIGLYKKHGFDVISVRKNYYSEPVEDGIVMEKKVTLANDYEYDTIRAD